MFPNAIPSSRGEEAERYDGFGGFREAGNGGCLGVVPLPFDRREGGVSLDSDAVADIPFDVMSV
jgi:hypothetical protein